MTTHNSKDSIINHFKDKGHFSKDELASYFLKKEPDITGSTIKWRIYDLRKKNVLRVTGRGIYVISNKPEFDPVPDNKLSRVNSLLLSGFKPEYYNLWTTRYLLEFTLHQALNHQLIVETDKDALEPAFNRLRDNGHRNVYLSPDAQMVEKYINGEPESIILKPMISRAPVIKKKNIYFSSLEKILVDIFCEPELFIPYQGNELVTIFRNAVKLYPVNFSTLLNYARRRSRYEQVSNFMEQAGIKD